MATQAKELPPIVRQKTDFENGHISKEQFQSKRRKQRELEAKMKAYEATARAEIEAESAGVTPGIPASEENEETAVRRGRPRK